MNAASLKAFKDFLGKEVRREVESKSAIFFFFFDITHLIFFNFTFIISEQRCEVIPRVKKRMGHSDMLRDLGTSAEL